MTVIELMRELEKFPPDDLVEVFVGDLENKGMSMLRPASKVIRCPQNFGKMGFLDANTTVWVT